MDRAADFFVSYTAADRAWAEWVAWQLEQAGYQVILQAWDFEPGDNFLVRMRDALEQSDRTLALISAAYLASPYCTDEWTGAFLHDPDGRNRLLQVRIEACELPRLLRTQVHIDLADLPPQQAMARLLAELKRGRRKPATEPPFPTWRAGSTGPRFPGRGVAVTNLPPRNPDFSGRSTLLKELHETLTTGGAMAVVQAATVHGLGGIGKTQLALEYAHRYATDYDVIWWVPAEQPVAIPGLLAGLARRLGVPEQGDQAELLASLWDVLRERDRWLLIYDNAEGPRELAPYRPPSGSGRVLITSRTPIWGRTATAVRLDVLERDEAVAFLRRRTARSDTATAAALAEALGDLPLALEQAAAYMDETHTTPADYLALFREHGAELLALGEPLTTEQTVTTTWQVALDRVRATPAAQELLSLCAFLAPDDVPRPLLREHAEALPEPLRGTIGRPLAHNQVVSTLGRYSLVTGTADTLTTHRLVQTVVRASLRPKDQQRWADTAIRLVLAAFPDDSDEVRAWPTCARLLPHALAAADHASSIAADPEATAGLLTKVGRYLGSRTEFRQARQILEGALTIREAHLDSDHLDLAQSLNDLGSVLRQLGEFPAARAAHQRALAIREAQLGPDHPDVADSVASLGLVLGNQGELHAARDAHQRALAIRQAQLGPDHAYVAQSLSNLGNVLRELGDLPAAREALEHALTIREARHGPDHHRLANSLSNLGFVLHDLGELQAARDAHQRALAIRETQLGSDHRDTAYSHTNLGAVQRELGELQAARTHHEQALAIFEARLGPDNPDVAMCLDNLGLALADLGELPAARDAFARAVAIRRARLGPDHPETLNSMSHLVELRRQPQEP
jgi:tetratricopeptide (TPR) repeat protein